MSSSGSGQPTQATAPAQPTQVTAPTGTDLPAEGQTLHEFALSLLTDDAARTAFAADPHGSLTAAGLGEFSVQDLQDALPFVADYAPAADLRAVTEALTSATEVTGGLNPAATAGHLETGSDWFTSASTLDAVDGLHGATAGATNDLGYAADLTAGDDSLLAAYALESEQVTSQGHVAFAEDRFAAAAGSDLGTVAAAATSSGAAVAAGAAGFQAEAGFASTVDFSDPTALLDGVALPEVEVSAAGAGALSTAGLTDQFHLPELDPTGALDSDSLDSDSLRGADLAAGTVADYVSAGGELLNGATANLGGFLTGASPLEDVEEISEHLRATLPQPVPAPEPAQHLPVDTGALPELPELSDLPHLPGGLPGLPGHLPVDLPGGLPHLPTDLPHLPELPVDLPHLPHLPVEVPDLPVANPLPDVASQVSHSVGGLTDGGLGDHGLLDVGGLTGDLDLGH
ncbi:IniB N-terminal domain-containing protein [Actinokineospora diospyrosa]|uniref:Uncharacterized protein n=1 Tax=Actinokineospora diospyrosa TaxID=103728 RepID=A0ABT1I7Y1_9PSEU|nr:IniB N-terminal domain-containing protein [Actinokineospora diospyrosa]MCP2268698.1 hypothetical protein [Actinokineospora diospyrosa]